jgi:hypothetical protein
LHEKFCAFEQVLIYAQGCVSYGAGQLLWGGILRAAACAKPLIAGEFFVGALWREKSPQFKKSDEFFFEKQGVVLTFSLKSFAFWLI